jgi:hypothetical protein
VTDSDEPRDGSTCGCCSTVDEDKTHTNQPGQPSLRYRIGTHGAFLRRMIRRLPFWETRDGSGPTRRPLAKLTTQETSDPSVALLDAFAVMADVLTFYQERIANECYLRTATERRSVLELAREISYELNPGVAAGTSVAFTVETAKGAPESVTILEGTKVQSLPAPGKLPQTFETSDDLIARPEWNALKPRTKTAQAVTAWMTSIVLRGITTDIKPGNAVLFISGQEPATTNWALKRITKVTQDNASATTTVDMEYLSGFPAIPNDSSVYLFHDRANLFGHNAPDWKSIGSTTKKDQFFPGLLGEYYYGTNFNSLIRRRIDPQICFDWHEGTPFPSIGIDHFSIIWTGYIRPEIEGWYTFATRSDDGVRLWIDGNLVIDDWKLHDNSQSVPSGPIYLYKGIFYDLRLEYFENEIYASVDLRWKTPDNDYYSPEVTIPKDVLFCYGSDRLPEWPYLELNDAEKAHKKIHLDTIYPKIISGSIVVLSCPGTAFPCLVAGLTEDARADFSLTAKTTCVTLSPLISDPTLPAFSDKIRETVVFCQSEPAPLAEVAETAAIEAGQDTIIIDGSIQGLTEGKRLIIAGMAKNDGKPVSEEVILAESVPGTATTTLTFADKFLNSYQRDTVTIFANVVPVTHGETVNEVLGSGNAGIQNQKFVLKKPPLTYVQASTPSGGKSTLSVRVDGLEWYEVPTLYGKKATDDNYQVRINDDTSARVIFGDGKRGARPTTGSENITALYRSGTGPDGDVAQGTLSLLPVRPAGIREVTNPVAATGAAPPEERDHARRNAPIRVRTFDRVVSLQDYEDYARAYTGIEKAKAMGAWSGEEHCVQVTVAGPDGNRVDDVTVKNLEESIREFSDPGHPVSVNSYTPVYFTVSAEVTFNVPRYKDDAVRSSIKTALLATFSFDNRSFGQAVTDSEITRTIQDIPGVISVQNVRIRKLSAPKGDYRELEGDHPDYDILYGGETFFHPDIDLKRIRAALARYFAGTIECTEILQISQDGITINGVKL